MRRLLTATILVLAGLLLPASTSAAAVPSVFDGAVSCSVQTVPAFKGQTWCGTGRWDEAEAKYDPQPGTRSTVKSWDGVPIDVNFALPDEVQWGAGPHPLVFVFHGYGQWKFNFDYGPIQHWLNKGYAVLTQSNRGFRESCGTPGAKAADPKCVTDGWVRLDDTRYEVRDAQLFAGMLVDEGLVQPTKIAATGNSYGAGMSMALAALKDRVMMPDSTYAPWKSPDGTPMSLAVAAPLAPWTDLAYALAPNGSNLDYLRDSSYYGPVGVMKQQWVAGLYLSGQAVPGNYAPAGTVPNGDLAGWLNLLNAGEPYDLTPGSPASSMLDEIISHHSSYYIDHSEPPAPLLITMGFADDVFPATEALRYYNRTRAEYPDAPIGLFLGGLGHQRAIKASAAQATAQAGLTDHWIDWYLTGSGSKPASDVTTYAQVCPNGAPDVGPFVTSDWVSQSPGEIRLLSKPAQTVQPWATGDAASKTVSKAFDSITTADPCAAPGGSKQLGTANWELAPAPAGGYTVMGSVTVIAKIQTTGNTSQLAARLVDVSPDGSTKTLIERGLWRPANSGYQVFQLYANGWTVKPDHVLRLELLPSDNAGAATNDLANYSRPSNGQQPVIVSDMDLRIPVRNEPGSLGNLVTKPAPRVLPDRPGASLAKGNEEIGSVTMAVYANGRPSLTGKVTVKGTALTAGFTCPAGSIRCAPARVVFKGAPKGGNARGRNVTLATGTVKTAPGKTTKTNLKLTAAARKLFRDTKKNGRKIRGLKSLRTRVTIAGKKAGFVTVKRAGRVN